MKINIRQMFSYILTVLLLTVTSDVWAGQGNDRGYFVIHGIVKDKTTNKRLENVNIYVPGMSVGTVTNAEGEFTLKIRDSLNVPEIAVSHIGYYNYRMPVRKEGAKEESIYLTPTTFVLNEIIARPDYSITLIEEAIRRIGQNYSADPNVLTGFYRETIQKGNRYINIAEAILDVYKNSYLDGVGHDRVRIFKGRQILGQRKNDTLAVKLSDGPNLALFLDVVKNPELILSMDMLPYYSYTREDAVFINDRLQYVVYFRPRIILPYPLYEGRFYLDSESLAITRAEFKLDMRDREKASNLMLKRKPAGLRFKPMELSFLVTYKQQNGKSYLNYIRNQIVFKCDWKKRLFSSNYTLVTEMVVTDRADGQLTPIPYKESFRANGVFADRVQDFSDESFWGAYNIIEPTKSLESGVQRLKKQQE